MPEYIDKSVVLDQISKQKLFYDEERKQSGDCLEEMNYVGAENGLTALEDVISDIPAADVAPVVHGRWKGWITPAFYGLDDFGDPIYRDAIFYRCSICGRKSAIKENFCPNCGAKLDLEDD